MLLNLQCRYKLSVYVCGEIRAITSNISYFIVSLRKFNGKLDTVVRSEVGDFAGDLSCLKFTEKLFFAQLNGSV